MVLTIIISDVTPIIYEHNPARNRSIQIELTKEQMAIINDRHDNEKIAMCFLEHPRPTGKEE